MFPGRRGRGRAGGLGAGRGARGPAPCLPGVLATGGRAGRAWGAVRAPSRALRVSEARGRVRPAGAGVFAAVRVGGETGDALGPRFWPSPRLPLLSSGPRCAPSPCLSRARPALPPRGHPAPSRAPSSAAAPRAPARTGRTLVPRPFPLRVCSSASVPAPCSLPPSRFPSPLSPVSQPPAPARSASQGAACCRRHVSSRGLSLPGFKARFRAVRKLDFSVGLTA